MRVVAGSAGGRRLSGATHLDIRPTTDKVREATFNSLGSLGVIDGAAVLDLFAGTGACGIEALSRGARSATFVDNDRRSLDLVKTNLNTTGFKGDVIKSDGLRFVERRDQFDVAFVDPPYEFDEWIQLLSIINAHVLVCESDRPIPVVSPWTALRERRYGKTVVTIFTRQSSTKEHDDEHAAEGRQ